MSELAVALTNYIRSAQKLAKEEDECDYDADYFLSEMYEEVKENEQAFINCLMARLSGEAD